MRTPLARINVMVDFGVAIAWLAISAVSVVGLSAYARTIAASLAENELAAFAFDDQFTPDHIQVVSVHAMLSSVAVGGLTSAAAGDVGAASL
jgi:hypothetical protein